MEGRGAGMDFAYRWLEVESARGRAQSDLCCVMWRVRFLGVWRY